MKAILTVTAVMLLSSAVYAGNCNLPSTQNPEFVADGAECEQMSDHVTIEKPKVVYFGKERDIIIAQRDGLIKFKFLYTAEEMTFLCNQYGFNEYVDSEYANIRIVGKGVFVQFDSEGHLINIEEMNKTPYRKSLKSLTCR